MSSLFEFPCPGCNAVINPTAYHNATHQDTFRFKNIQFICDSCEWLLGEVYYCSTCAHIWMTDHTGDDKFVPGICPTCSTGYAIHQTLRLTDSEEPTTATGGRSIVPPAEAVRRFKEAVSHMQQGKNERAIECFQEAISLGYHLPVADAYLQDLFKREYATRYRDVVERCVETIKNLQKDALYVYQAQKVVLTCFPPTGSLTSDISRFSGLIESDPSFAYGYFLRGVVCKLYQQKSEAISDFKVFLARTGPTFPLVKEAQQYLDELCAAVNQ